VVDVVQEEADDTSQSAAFASQLADLDRQRQQLEQAQREFDQQKQLQQQRGQLEQQRAARQQREQLEQQQREERQQRERQQREQQQREAPQQDSAGLLETFMNAHLQMMERNRLDQAQARQDHANALQEARLEADRRATLMIEAVAQAQNLNRQHHIQDREWDCQRLGLLMQTYRYAGL
jgi:hypothetical protein